MDFSEDSLNKEILLQADDPTIVNSDTQEPPVSDPASGLESTPSLASNLPIRDLAILYPTHKRGKGKPFSGTRLSQEPGNLHADSHPNPTLEKLPLSNI